MPGAPADQSPALGGLASDVIPPLLTTSWRKYLNYITDRQPTLSSRGSLPELRQRSDQRQITERIRLHDGSVLQ